MKEPEERKWLVLVAVIITVLLKFILADWLGLRVFYITSACLFWLVYIRVRYKRDPTILKKWGFQKQYFSQSLIFLLPFAITALVGIILYGVVNNFSFLNWHIIPILVLYPAWGIIQQFIVAGLVAGSLRRITEGKMTGFQINLLVSISFSLIHFPGIHLMIYAFIMEFIFIHAYFKYNNLWSLGICHGFVSSLFMYIVLERELWNELLLIFK